MISFIDNLPVFIKLIKITFLIRKVGLGSIFILQKYSFYS